jgi:hypothetical protein
MLRVYKQLIKLNEMKKVPIIETTILYYGYKDKQMR